MRLTALLAAFVVVACSAGHRAQSGTIDPTGDWAGETSQGKIIAFRVNGNAIDGLLMTWTQSNPNCSAHTGTGYWSKPPGSIRGDSLSITVNETYYSVKVTGTFDGSGDISGSVSLAGSCPQGEATWTAKKTPVLQVDGSWGGTLADGTPLSFTVQNGRVGGVSLDFNVCFDSGSPRITENFSGLGSAFTIIGNHFDSYFTSGAVPNALGGAFATDGTATGELRTWNLNCDLSMSWSAVPLPGGTASQDAGVSTGPDAAVDASAD
jgi:hypothetical protein